MNFERMKQSAKDFATIVWPYVSDYLGGGKLVTVEAHTETAIARELDMVAGIDAWTIEKNQHGIIGIASRVQSGAMDYRSFTMRKATRYTNETEFSKRQRAVHANGKYLYPDVYVQAYVDVTHAELISVAVAKTRDIVEFIEHGLANIRTNREDGNTFYVAWWDAGAMRKYKGKGNLTDWGAEVFIYPPGKQEALIAI